MESISEYNLFGTFFINDKKTGRTYWLEEGRFSSAPTQLDNQPDLQQIDCLSDWENMEDFEEDPANFQHLIKILERLVQVDGPLQFQGGEN
tara:strand:- start:199 stop:471 length:273 start_codon:yes stop_codon:yes gene_type:complete